MEKSRRTSYWGAWIEISSINIITIIENIVAPRIGVRGLKYSVQPMSVPAADVAPRIGVRGLKYKYLCTICLQLLSHLVLGCVD